MAAGTSPSKSATRFTADCKSRNLVAERDVSYSRRQRLLAMGANSIEADHRRKSGRFGFIVFIVILLTPLLLLV